MFVRKEIQVMQVPRDVNLLLKEGIGATWYDIPGEKQVELIMEYIKAEALEGVADAIRSIATSISTTSGVVKQIYLALVPEIKRLVDMMERVVEDYPKTTPEPNELP